MKRWAKPEDREQLFRRAMSKVSQAVSKGRLPDLSDGHVKCSDCDNPADRYDHRDYERPLMVEPVCCACNARRGPAEPYSTTMGTANGTRWSSVESDIDRDEMDWFPGHVVLNVPEVPVAMSDLSERYFSGWDSWTRDVDPDVVTYYQELQMMQRSKRAAA